MRDRINSCIRILRVHKGLTLLFTLCDSESRTGISVSGRCEQEASVCDESTDWASGRPEFRASQLRGSLLICMVILDSGSGYMLD